MQEFVDQGDEAGIAVDSSLAVAVLHQFREHDGRELVVLLRILTHDSNYGYQLANGMVRGSPGREESSWFEGRARTKVAFCDQWRSTGKV